MKWELIRKEIESLEKRIDEVLAKLDQLGLGQEIIFDEIDSLKSKSRRLTKKDFGVILVGQLVAFGSSTIDKQLMNQIIEGVLDLKSPGLLE